MFVGQKGARKLHEQQEVVGSLKGHTKVQIQKFEEQMQKSYNEQLKRIAEMVEAKLREATTRLEPKLTEEQAARMRAEEQAQLAQMKSNDEIRNLKESMERARKETEELQVCTSDENIPALMLCILDERTDILTLCGNQRVLFDNKAKDQGKKTAQVQELFSLVDAVISQNGGKPFSDEIFAEMRKGAKKLQEQQEQVLKFKEEMQKSYDGQLKRISEMLREEIKRLEQKVAEEQAARMRAEEQAHLVQAKSNDEIHDLRKSLQRARKETAAPVGGPNQDAPFYNMFVGHKGARKLHEQQEAVGSIKGHTKVQIQKFEMVEAKLREMTTRLEHKLAEEPAAHMRAEEQAQLAQMKSNDEIRNLRESLERTTTETEELRNQTESRCAIL
ncbi:hypothetical protein CDL15_Pgr028357 [Punica granatum]|uniref:AIG1-type G domain-containing protein n=1 Tax=Punica granatum TaxID=22663 RepID=A0A218W3R9_PUNGR|nr:hypothetical protein CDL15_Pgr028357 [Punica granatum]